MKRINIVMIEPEIPQNTGNVARTAVCANASLHLVKPFGFEITDKHLKRAGLDYWKDLDVAYYESSEEFFEKNRGARFFFFTTKGQKRYTEVQFQDGDFLVFGKESKGLPEKLLFDNYENCVRIPMQKDMRSLNLANSICVAVYEVMRQWDFCDLSSEGHLTQF